MDDALQNAGQWPIFICYRQADGQTAAARIFSLLNEQIVPISDATIEEPTPVLDVYYDQAAPGVSDWTAVHEPFLKRARAMILICTPGAKLNEGSGDWVHHEIDWWLQNRAMAPILVDPLSQELRYVPSGVAQRWPNAQRIKLNEDDWEGLSDSARLALDDRLREQFLGAIVPSSDAFYRQELEQDNARTQKLQNTRRTIGVMALLLIAVMGAAAWIFSLKNQAETASAAAQRARQAELAARELAEVRLIESQAVRASTEARLFADLQKLERFRAYWDQMQDWQIDFEQRAARLGQIARSRLPKCEIVAGFTIYEGQIVPVNAGPDDRSEWMWAYLAVVPGQSSASRDRAPAVLDVFLAKHGDIEAGRDRSRAYVKDQIKATNLPENKILV